MTDVQFSGNRVYGGTFKEVKAWVDKLDTKPDGNIGMEDNVVIEGDYKSGTSFGTEFVTRAIMDTTNYNVQYIPKNEKGVTFDTLRIDKAGSPEQPTEAPTPSTVEPPKEPDENVLDKTGKFVKKHGAYVLGLGAIGLGAVAVRTLSGEGNIRRVGRGIVTPFSFYGAYKYGRQGIEDLQDGQIFKGFGKLQTAAFLTATGIALPQFEFTKGIRTPIWKFMGHLAKPKVFGGALLINGAVGLAELSAHTALDPNASQTKQVLGWHGVGTSALGAIGGVELMARGMGYNFTPFTSLMKNKYAASFAGLGMVGDSIYFGGTEAINQFKKGNYNWSNLIATGTGLGIAGGLQVMGSGLKQFSNPVMNKIGNALDGLLTKNPRVVGGILFLNAGVTLGIEVGQRLTKEGYSFKDLNPYGSGKRLGVINAGLGTLSVTAGLTGAELFSRQMLGKGLGTKVWGWGMGIGLGVTAIQLGKAIYEKAKGGGTPAEIPSTTVERKED